MIAKLKAFFARLFRPKPDEMETEYDIDVRSRVWRDE